MARRPKRTRNAESVAERTERQNASGLPNWDTSAPSRNATHVVRADYNGNLIILVFGHVFAAKKMVDILVDEETFKWKTPLSIETERGIIIKSEQLEEIIEYEYRNEAEEEFMFPSPLDKNLSRFMLSTQEIADLKALKATVNTDGVTTRVKREKKESTPRPSKEGMTTIQDLCKELGIEPTNARAALRKGQFQKPPQGWAWSDKAEVNRVREYIKKHAKK